MAVATDALVKFSHGSPVSVAHTPAAAVTVGDVVTIGNMIAIADDAIDADRRGELKVGGVWTVTADAAIAAGDTVYWDDTNSKVSESVLGPLFGIALTASAADDDRIEVLHMAGGPHFGWMPNAAKQSLSGAGAVTVVEYKTDVTTTGADALTLADGLSFGQLKLIQMIVDGGDGTLTPTNLNGGTTITFADVGDYALLMWDGAGWTVLDLGNYADGATAPVLA
jgi:predicted RecA/RadA family phage recombinase